MNQEDQKKNKKFELTPLTHEQHAVTPVPKFTTELPFFYLTKKKNLLMQDIHYEGVDAAGNPIMWDVIPNRSSKIGVPGIEAHVIWTQLVKVAIEIQRGPDGQIPEIIPLGGIRQCLRIVGWKQGGWEARGLIQGLMQIGQSACDVDFMLPTGQLNDDGQMMFKSVKGIFNRFSIWKIGSKHISEEELSSGTFDFDFDLEDTLYIQLHKIERDIQRHQDQKYLDNQYMFSVEARARRWYELMSAKIFGVVKNNGSYVEVKYSWYVKHHHTLMRLYNRSRVVSQMNRIVADHFVSSFISKIEYRAIKDEKGEMDFLIRYYPGPEARRSVTRVLSFLTDSTLPFVVERRRQRKNKKSLKELSSKDRNHNQRENLEATDEHALEPAPKSEEPESNTLVLEALTSRGIIRPVAVNLVTGKSEESLQRVQDYIEYWDAIKNEKRPGLLVQLIRVSEELPSTFETRRQREERQAEHERLTKLTRYNDLMESKYAQYCKRRVDEFLAEVPVEEVEQRVASYKAEFLEQATFWSDKPELADQMARRAICAQIQEGTPLQSFEDFSQQNASTVLSELGLHSGDIGLDTVAGSLPGDVQTF